MGLIHLLLFLVSSSSACGQHPETVFEQANHLYQQGHYLQAAESYHRILQNGYTSFELEFNLGNAYYKLEKIPQAILHYERARRMRPQDGDLRHNLQLAHQRLRDRMETLPRLFVWDLLDRICAAFSMKGITWLSYFFYAACLGAWALLLVSQNPRIRKLSFLGGVSSGVLALIFFGIFLTKRAELLRQDQAILMADTATLKNAPDSKSSDAFVLHAGVKLRILDQVSGWIKIQLPDGKEGWLEGSQAEII